MSSEDRSGPGSGMRRLCFSHVPRALTHNVGEDTWELMSGSAWLVGTGRQESNPGSGSVQSGCVLVRKALPIQDLDFPIFKGKVQTGDFQTGSLRSVTGRAP